MQEMCLTPEGMGKASLLCGSPYPTEGGSHIKTVSSGRLFKVQV